MFNFLKKKEVGEELKLTINGMHCTSCAININGSLEDLDGVHSADTSYAKGVVSVRYDPDKISKKKIMAVIEAEGYQPAENV